MNDMQADELNEMLFEGMLETVLKAPALEKIDASTIREATAHHQNGERLLDILLRIGPYGDRFGEARGGLTLDKVMNSPHGIDLGPLQSGILPDMLRTEGAAYHCCIHCWRLTLCAWWTASVVQYPSLC